MRRVARSPGALPASSCGGRGRSGEQDVQQIESTVDNNQGLFEHQSRPFHPSMSVQNQSSNRSTRHPCPPAHLGAHILQVGSVGNVQRGGPLLRLRRCPAAQRAIW